MRVLLDECVDWRLSRHITGHEVKTAHQMGWATIKNGELLTLAAEQFDVFVTVDRNLSLPAERRRVANCGDRAACQEQPPCRSQVFGPQPLGSY